MEDQKIVSKIRIRVQIPKEPVKEYQEKWKESMIKSARKIAQGMKESISGLGDYAQKIAKHTIKETISYLNPNRRTKTGRTYRQVIEKMLSNIPDNYKKYQLNTEHLFETVDGEEAKRYKEKIEVQAYWAALKMSRRVFPFTGYRDKVRGVAPMAIRWLTGDESVFEMLTASDTGLGGPILITAPDRTGKFRKALTNRIRKAGSRLMQTTQKDKARAIAEENELTNELVSEYTAKGLEVRVDFITENDVLYLEIEVSRK